MIKKIFRFCAVFFLALAIAFFDVVQLWNFPPEIKVSDAAVTTIILNYRQTILTEGTSWTVPSDWTDGNNTIEVIGGGGSGRTDTTGAAGAGGGGGGAYSSISNLDLTPGATVTYQIGQGGATTTVNGGDTFFNRTSGSAGTCADTTSVCAKGGTGATSATGAAGGVGASGTGTVKNNGGTGGTGNTTSDSGGGGGGAGGPNGVGGTGGAGDTDNATDGVGGGGGGNGGGANGGSGITSDTVGANGGNGNGGSGGGTGGTAADGANGTAGTGGGGGGGADNFDGGNGAYGTDFSGGVVGSGGGGGGTGDTSTTAGMGGGGGLYGGGGGGGRYGGKGAPGIIVITYNGNTPTMSSWVVPADWNDADNTVIVIGGGGAGVSAAQGTGSAGGGGGAYSSISNLDLTPGASVTYQIGSGGRKTTVGAGAGTAGGDTFFNRTAGSAGTCADTTSVCAKGGSAGSGTTGGAGGASGSGTGTTKLSGGAGGAGNSTGDTGGGGGGAGGTAVGQVGGAGSASTNGGGGGGGGAGGSSSSVGQAGQATVGGTGGNGPAGTGSGAAGNAGAGGGGTAATGGGGGGGDDVSGGGTGGSGSSTLYGGGGGGGGGDGNTAATSASYGADGGLFGGGGGGGLTNGFGANGIIIITYTPSLFTQAAYRLFNNANSADVGSVLAAQDTVGTLASSGDAFRLRLLLHVTDGAMGASGQTFKLQFATRSGTCDTAFSGETYADVTGATAIAYNNNATPADGDNLTANANDPTHGGDTIVNQDYEEANNFTNTVAAVPAGQDAKWDFSLIDNGAPADTAYCFRVVKSDASLLDTYSVVPQITTAAAVSLTFTVSTDNFPTLNPGTPVFATSTLVIGTSHSTGWNVTVARDDADTTLDLATDAATNITDQTAWNPGGATTSAGNAARISSFANAGDVLAFRVMTASGTTPFRASTWWGSTDTYTDTATTIWAGLPSTAEEIGNSSVSPGGSALNTVLYYLDVPTSQVAGSYTGNITYTAVVNP